MDWSSLGSLFSLELTVGTFAFLALTYPAPLAPFFYRLNGAFAAVGLIVAWWLKFFANTPTGLNGTLLWTGSVVAMIGYLISCGSIRSLLRRNVLWVSFAGSLLALFAAVASFSPGSLGTNVFFTVSLALSGLIVGGVAISMFVGHSYLTVPGMEISHLAKVNWATAISMLLKLLCGLALLWVFSEELHNEDRDLFRPMGLFFTGTRMLVGIVFPFVFALMVIGCLKHKATRSATGILYASTIFVIVGEAIGFSIWNSYGVPI